MKSLTLWISVGAAFLAGAIAQVCYPIGRETTMLGVWIAGAALIGGVSYRRAHTENARLTALGIVLLLVGSLVTLMITT